MKDGGLNYLQRRLSDVDVEDELCLDETTRERKLLRWPRTSCCALLRVSMPERDNISNLQMFCQNSFCILIYEKGGISSVFDIIKSNMESNCVTSAMVPESAGLKSCTWQ